MKRIISLILGMTMLVSLAACTAGAPQSSAETPAPTASPSGGADVKTSNQPVADPGQSGSGSILVSYFAYSENMGDTSGMTVDAVTSASLNRSTDNTEGNLQVMALEISEKKNADVFHILMREPFDPDYSTMLDGAIQQIQAGTLPPLQAQVENLEQYDVVFLGIPVWSGQLPPAVLTFLSENDLSGKTIVPFGIHLGSRFGRMIDQIKELCPDANVLDGFTVNAATANSEVKTSVGEWLDTLEID